MNEELILLPQPRKLMMRPGASRSNTVVTRVEDLPAQGYRLTIAPQGVEIVAADEAGLFYGRQTLRQIQRQCPDGWPACEITDWPDFSVRGVMLDISRDKVPKLETLFMLVDEFAEWKINHLELYMEHTFAYRNHRDVWAQASPFTAKEIRQLDAYCRERFIELVPNQNSFGHFERWLKHPAYQHLAASKAHTCLDPANPQSLALLEEMYAELLPNFTSRKFNVGCDETYGIGGRVYLDFLLEIYRLVKSHGHTMHFWGDIVIHHPELVAELPRDVVVLEWGYEADHKFEEHGALFAKTEIPFYVCPGTSSWNAITGRTDNCLENLRNAAANGLKYKATGFLNTDWGDHGHWQYWPVSYLGFAAGAALSWCYEANRTEDFIAALDTHVFHDEARVMGRLAFNLGNAYLELGKLFSNSTGFFRLLHDNPPQIPAENLHCAAKFVEAVTQPLRSARINRADATLIQDEFANAVRMTNLACRRGLGGESVAEMKAIITEHRRLWRARNREGGLEDSVRLLGRNFRGHQS